MTTRLPLGMFTTPRGDLHLPQVGERFSLPVDPPCIGRVYYAVVRVIPSGPDAGVDVFHVNSRVRELCAADVQ